MESTSEEVVLQTDEPWKDIKVRHVYSALRSDPVDIKFLRQCATSKGGLLRNALRKVAWPKLLAVDIHHIPEYKGPPLHDHKEKAQVMLDVNRCGRRIPEEFTELERTALQEQLARIILRVLASNSDLCYYQGLHDVTLTVLLVVEDEDITFAILNVLVQYHLRDFLDSNMKYTKQVIGYINPLLSMVDEKLRDFILKSECQYYFSLSWLITWFSHDIANPECVNRLFDFFLASHPIVPVYYSAALILSRRDDILALECEMSAIHGLLSKLPSDLDYEKVVGEATQLFREYPISLVASTGRIRMNDSYLNWSHGKFERLVKRQRPDHVLKDMPSQSIATTTSLQLLLYSAGPVVLGVFVYWLIRHDYHHRLYMILNYAT